MGKLSEDYSCIAYSVIIMFVLCIHSFLYIVQWTTHCLVTPNEPLPKKRAQKIAPRFALLPKLKFEHVSLSSFSKMRVDLAAQVYIVQAVCTRTHIIVYTHSLQVMTTMSASYILSIISTGVE